MIVEKWSTKGGYSSFLVNYKINREFSNVTQNGRSLCVNVVYDVSMYD